MKSANLVSNCVLSQDYFDPLVFCDLIQQNRPRRDGKSTQKNCTKKYLSDPDNHHRVVSYSEPDILKCELKCHLASTAVSEAGGGDGIPPELFKILKDDAIKVLYSVCQQIWKTRQFQQDWKRPILIPIPKKGSKLRNVQATEQLQSSPMLVRLYSIPPG